MDEQGLSEATLLDFNLNLTLFQQQLNRQVLATIGNRPRHRLTLANELVDALLILFVLGAARFNKGACFGEQCILTLRDSC